MDFACLRAAFVAASLVTLLACSPESTKPTAVRAEVPFAYSIMSDESKPPHKRTVEVQLETRATPEQLESLATAIKAAGKNDVARTFIGYRLKDGDPDSAYWATSHFNPDLEIKYQGLSPEGYEQLLSADTDHYEGRVGRWMIEYGINYLAVLNLQDGQMVLNQRFKDGGQSATPLLHTMQPDGTLRLDEPENDFGEYYTLDREGNLRFWNAENKNFLTVASLEPVYLEQIK